ncbi:pyruvate dehydrogenase (acetyl-transferring) E1 component subunit alpha [Kitasatospora azatica]|uniref:pyruvate dehydrogenase (acetyl-transferring) E1 component subunit alpha n=1 Tax=Kitasatospora azatica TaxID=58347 RepID=UPI000B2CD21C|nr:pyruvate dehydrogenase (acetyl-transferring) E1 component subunit alpha [Kitasatospora azatica]
MLSESVETVQLLSSDGEWIDHPDYPAAFSAEEVRSLYRDMALLRAFDSQAVILQRQGELALWAPSLGQEAAQIGAGRALAERDYAFTSYREHGIARCRGIGVAQMLGFWRGVGHGGWQPDQYRMANAMVVIGAQALHGVGYAMGMALAGEDAAALVCFGDGATSQGDVHEAMVWAASFDAPTVFLCQNNQWAISEPWQRQSRIPLARRAAGFGFPGIRVDGNDVLACLAVTRACLERARRGQGPSLIEAYTYRLGAHTTSDEPSRYRESAEEEYWRSLDPLARVKAYLLASGGADEEFFDRTAGEAAALGSAVREVCLSMTPPAPSSFFDHVYAEPHPLLAQERAQFEEWLAGELQEG